MAITYKIMKTLTRLDGDNKVRYEVFDSAGRKMIAPDWYEHEDEAFAAGQHIVKDGILYRFLIPHTAGAAWNSAEVLTVTVAEDIAAIVTALNQRAYKVSGATANNFAALTANGDLKDSGKKASDFATAQDISGKADKTDTVLNTTLSRGRKANTTVGEASFAFGVDVTASDVECHAEGYNTTASNSQAHAEGNSTTASGTQSHAEGLSTIASSSQSHAEGINTTASGYQSHAEGNNTTASGSQSHAEGINTTASGGQAHTEGAGTVASAYSAHAEGLNTTASGSKSHAEGFATVANHASQHVFGEHNVADDSSATATEKGKYVEIVGNGTSNAAKSNARTLDWEGNERLKGNLFVRANADGTGGSMVATMEDTVLTTTLSRGRKANTTVGVASFAFGDNVEASAYCAHAEGGTTEATAYAAHAEGVSTHATNTGAHSEGNGTVASGVYSHAEGNLTTASGVFAHSEGSNTTASGLMSHTEGAYTVANHAMQSVFGIHNVPDPSQAGSGDKGNYVEIVGNGTDANTKSNARTLDWNGNERLAGDLYVHAEEDGTGGDKVATEDELDDLSTELKSAFNKSFYYPTLTSSDVVDGYYINGGNGYPISSSSYKCTGFISLKDLVKGSALRSKVTFYSLVGYAFYNASKQYISGESGTSRGISSRTTLDEVLTIPENAEYFRTTLFASEYSAPSDFMIGFENFNKLGEIEDKKITELRKSLDNGRQSFALYSNFQQAGLDANGALLPSQNYRASCGNHIKFDNDVVVSVQSGYQWGYYAFPGGWSGWKNSDYTITANTEFVVQIMKTPESTSDPADVDVFVGAVTFNTLIGVINDSLYFNFKPYHGSITSKSNVKNYPNENELFSADSIVFATTGESYCGIDKDIIDPIGGNVLCVHSERSTGNNWKIRVVSYDSSNNIITNVNTNTNDIAVPIPQNAKKVNITLGACWGTALASGTNVTFSNISVKYVFANGNGNQLYKGKQITLENDNTEINKCNISLWKDFTNVSSYSLHLNEAMAIYNGYVFLFNGGGGGIVVDYSTKNIISAFDTAPTEKNHQNSAQFTDIFYDVGDEFPLLLIARCGNTDGVTTGYDECLVYRVTKSGTDFTFTLVNSIAFDKRTYGTSWGIDNATKTLYVTSTVNGNWSVTTNNPLNWWAFNMPSKEYILSGNTITLTEADAVAHAEADFAVQQGCSVKHGLMFEAVQQLNGTQIKDAMIYAVDVFKNQIVSKVPLLITDEPEGVDVYNGKLYVTQKKGTDTAGNNPLKIYEIEF